jgi:hypothetical protein
MGNFSSFCTPKKKILGKGKFFDFWKSIHQKKRKYLFRNCQKLPQIAYNMKGVLLKKKNIY